MHLTECLVHEPDLLTAGEEYEDFGLKVGLDKTPESVEFFVELDYGVVLFEGCRGDLFFPGGYIDWILQAQTSEVRDRFRLSGGEEEGLARPW